MTVSSTANKIAYTGNGATTLYAFPYPFIASSDLQVYVAGVLKTLTTDYTISGTAPYPAGANVTFVAAPANLASIVIIRTRPYTQTLDLVANDPLPADDTEREFDHVVMLAQQLNEAISRAITIPSTDVTGTTTTLPDAATRANKSITFDASGNVQVGAVATATVSAAMIPVVQAATLALARVALGIGSNFTTEGTIVAAATTDLGSLSSQEIVITGNTGITGFGNTASLAAPLYMLRFTGTPTITNSATMIIAGAANWTVAAGDMAIAKFEGTSTWRIFPILASGQALVGSLPSQTNNTGRVLGTNGTTASWFDMVGGFKNKVINGDLSQWNYATTLTMGTSAVYGSADRWKFYCGEATGGIANQEQSILGNSLPLAYNIKWGRTAAKTSTGEIGMLQCIESLNVFPLAGRTVTLSYYAKKGANYSGSGSTVGCALFTGTVADEGMAALGAWTGQATTLNTSDTLTTSYQRFQHTFTMPSTAKEAAIKFYWNGVGTAGADDNVYLSGVQLELGAVATEFEARTPTIEALLCARYMYSIGQPTGTAWGGYSTSTTAAGWIVPFQVPMRTTPSFSVVTPGNFTAYDYVPTGIIAVSTMALASATLVGAMITTTHGASLTANKGYVLVAGTALVGNVKFSAEL